MTSRARPLRLDDNRVPLYYRGGERISHFRRTSLAAGPEDWVGSTCTLPRAMIPSGHPATTGISLTEEGLLTDIIEKAPIAWLGRNLFERHHGNPAILVKLLDAGERLPVHCHPSRSFAKAHLGSCFGKTEGWIVMEAQDDANVWLGMRETIDYDVFQTWIDEGATGRMLAAMNEVRVAPDDVFFIPAGLPHAIGEGILVTELQEPVTLSISANHREFGLDEHAATLGLGWDIAVRTFDLTQKDPVKDGLISRPTRAAEHRGSVYSLFPPQAQPFFRALAVATHDGPAHITEASFVILVVVEGEGTVHGIDRPGFEVASGQTWVVPHSYGPLTFTGTMTATLCLPPSTTPLLP